MDTPDSVLQSGLGLGPGPDTALRSMVDPRDYDRLRFFQMSAAQPNTFEETIHRVSIQNFPSTSQTDGAIKTFWNAKHKFNLLKFSDVFFLKNDAK